LPLARGHGLNATQRQHLVAHTPASSRRSRCLLLTGCPASLRSRPTQRCDGVTASLPDYSSKSHPTRSPHRHSAPGSPKISRNIASYYSRPNLRRQPPTSMATPWFAYRCMIPQARYSLSRVALVASNKPRYPRNVSKPLLYRSLATLPSTTGCNSHSTTNLSATLCTAARSCSVEIWT